MAGHVWPQERAGGRTATGARAQVGQNAVSRHLRREQGELPLGGWSEAEAWTTHQRHDGAQLRVRRPRLPRRAEQVRVLEVVEAQRAERRLLQMRQQTRLVDAKDRVQQAVECGACGPAPCKQRPRGAAALTPRRHAARHILQLGTA